MTEEIVYDVKKNSIGYDFKIFALTQIWLLMDYGLMLKICHDKKVINLV